VLLFDPFHGAAGDMVTGALLSLLTDRNPVIRAMASVVGEPEISDVDRAGVRALQVRTRAGKGHRTLEEVEARVRGADAPAPAKEMVLRVFRRIHDAEARVHGGVVHFHEVGADDAVADVVGACTALRMLEPDGIVIRPVALGSGTIRGAHGTLPVPAPATAAILAASLLLAVTGQDDGELCTPTGAALLAEFATLPPLWAEPARILATGYGAGSRDTEGTPNVLRVFLLDAPGEPAGNRVDVLETNVDDVTGEVVAHAIQRLMEAGARDASALPAVMKKGRPGHLVRVVAAPEDSPRLAALLAEELGTLGVRCTPMVHRFVADRTTAEVEVTLGGTRYIVPVKYGRSGGKVISVKAEFGRVQAIAAESCLPARAVARAVEDAAWKQCREGGP
ncbi:MAG: nickel pincer cofactor biosynthesis protein LarC, partial [Methanomicrobiales archaeon]|nr:nickel pincer cofactor biosynthesis protein LarC [Methanomicrobiales archaeon]